MTRQKTTADETLQTWRKAALRYPEAQEGTSCDRSAFKARDKAFLFMGAEDHSCNAMVKLRESLEEAARLAEDEDEDEREDEDEDECELEREDECEDEDEREGERVALTRS